MSTPFTTNSNLPFECAFFSPQDRHHNDQYIPQRVALFCWRTPYIVLSFKGFFELYLVTKNPTEKVIYYQVCYQVGEEMFIPDSSFKNIIFQELEKGDKSISSLHRVLTDEGHKVHRLVLTGYLKAMEEMGVLTSREFPPSKVYSISASAEKDIYITVGKMHEHGT